MRLNNINHLGVLLTILLGISVFVCSVITLNRNINPGNVSLKLYLYDSSGFIKSQNGDIDTLLVNDRKNMLEYLDQLQKDSTIIQFNPAFHHVRKQYNLEENTITYMLDTSQHKTFKKYHFKRSELIYNKLLFSLDSAHLDSSITQLDAKYAEKYVPYKESKRYFLNRYPQLMLWILLISIAIGISWSFIPMFTAKIRTYHVGSSKFSLFINIIIAAIIIIFLFLPIVFIHDSENNYLLKPLDFLNLFQVGLLPKGLWYNSIMPFAGSFFWLILVLTIITRIHDFGTTNSPENLQLFVAAREDFETTFKIIAVFLAFTIFCTSIFINGLNDLTAMKDQARLIPMEMGFINGLMQTFFLFLIYFVVNTSFQEIGKKIVQDGSTDTNSINAILKGKTSMEYVKLILTILAPILGNGLQEIIKLVVE